MHCLVCSYPMNFFFSKKFNSYGLDQVQYWRCENCGFTISKTHADLSAKRWQELNVQYHSTYQGEGHNPDDHRWIERLHTQADILTDLSRIGLLDKTGRWLDFACGDGKLSAILKKQHNLDLLKYDPYMPATQGHLTENDLSEGAFDFVITTSVFEHFTKREDYEFIESLVSNSQGILGLHTLVCENIPFDPSWFYLLPVHTAFFTNKSMDLLFKQWGYKASIYNVEGRLWLWFKTDPREIQPIVAYANKRKNAPKYIFRRGFVDYWK